MGWLLYGTLMRPYLFGSVPLPAALYGVLVFPFIWGLTEQMTYNGGGLSQRPGVSGAA